MQKVATRVFILASIMFGIVGICLVLTLPGAHQPDSELTTQLMRVLFATVFVILPSFALSVASKYLSGKS